MMTFVEGMEVSLAVPEEGAATDDAPGRDHHPSGAEEEAAGRGELISKK